MDTPQTFLQNKLKSGTQKTLEVAQGGTVTGYCHFLEAMVYLDQCMHANCDQSSLLVHNVFL
jgi:hypothetical protein